jgi:hypothetical protein
MNKKKPNNPPQNSHKNHTKKTFRFNKNPQNTSSPWATLAATAVTLPTQRPTINKPSKKAAFHPKRIYI